MRQLVTKRLAPLYFYNLRVSGNAIRMQRNLSYNRHFFCLPHCLNRNIITRNYALTRLLVYSLRTSDSHSPLVKFHARRRREFRYRKRITTAFVDTHRIHTTATAVSVECDIYLRYRLVFPYRYNSYIITRRYALTRLLIYCRFTTYNNRPLIKLLTVRRCKCTCR